jgi:hypothetical protein
MEWEATELLRVSQPHDLLLVGGLEHEFYDFPYIGNNNPI